MAPAAITSAEDRPSLAALAALQRRIHEAMLTMSVQAGDGPRAKMTFWPDYLVEFSDRIGEERGVAEPPRGRFAPSGSQIDDMLAALGLLEGLRVEYFKLVFLKAIRDEAGTSSWEGLGAHFGRSGTWAKETYNRAIIQAARRAGLLRPVRSEHAVFCASILNEQVFLTCIGASADPRQTLYDLRAKNALPIIDAFAAWTVGKPLAQRIVEATKVHHGLHRRHGAWFRLNPLDAEDTVLTQAERIGAEVRLDYMT